MKFNKTIIHESWNPYIGNIINSPAMDKVESIVSQSTYFPHGDNVFKAFSMPFDKIRVVVIGQDPYHSICPKTKIPYATGLAFANNPNVSKIAYSLRVIMDELAINTIGDIALEENPNFYWDLNHWHEQGVLLLNTSLTVEMGKVGSHINLWKGFTGHVIRQIANNTKDVIWLLWGGKAHSLENIICGENTTHRVLKHTHPAAVRYGHEFVGCGHFNEVNSLLDKRGELRIQW